MGACRCLVSLVGALVVLSTLARAEAPPPSYLGIVPTAPIAIARAARVPTPIAVTPASGVELDKLYVDVLSIARDGIAQAVPSGAVTVERRPAQLALSLTVDDAKLFIPGTYDVTLGVVPRSDQGAGSNAAPPTRQILTFKIVIPAATVHTIPKLVMERELPYPFLDRGDVEPRDLAIHEIGNVSSIAPTVFQDGSLMLDDRPIGARVVQRSSPMIEPGKTGSVSLAIEGALPVGKVVGSLQLTARELGAPTSILLEIRTRHPTWWIFPLFLAGAALGLVWRVWSVRRRDALALQLRAQQVRRQIDDLLADAPASWISEISKLRTAGISVRDDDAGVIAAAENATRNFIVFRDQSLQLLATHIRDGMVVARTTWRLPMALSLIRAATAYDLARDHLAGGDVIDADQWNASGMDELRAVVDQARDWSARLARMLELASDWQIGIAAPLRGPLKAAMKRLTDGLQPVTTSLGAANPPTSAGPAQPVDSPAAANGVLASLHDGLVAARDFAGLLVDALGSIDRFLPASLSIDFATRLRSARAVPVGQPETPDVTIGDAIAASRRVAGVVNAIAVEIHGEPLGAELIAAIEHGEFATALAQPTSAAHTGRGSPAAARYLPVASAVALAVDLISPRPTPSPVVPMVRAVAAPVVSQRLLERKLGAVNYLRWAIAGVVTSLAAWALFGTSFVGTHRECVSIFAFGFITDLSTDSAIEAILARTRLPEPKPA